MNNALEDPAERLKRVQAELLAETSKLVDLMANANPDGYQPAEKA